MTLPRSTVLPAMRTATPSSIRAVNRSIVLNLIRRRQPVSRAELARFTGIFRSSVSEIVDELIAEDLVSEQHGSSRRGRRPVSLTLNDDRLRVLGFSMHPDRCQVAEAGLGGAIQHTISFPTPTDPEELVQLFVAAIHHLEFAVDQRLHGGYRRVGVSVPGHVDSTTGTILWVPTRPEWNGLPIAARISALTEMSVVVDNDCNAGALSEVWLRPGKNQDASDDFVFVNVGDHGVGAGIIIGGEPYRGHDSHFAGEFGHMVIHPEGPPCACGRRGCWERYVCNAATWERFRPDESFTIDGFEALLAAIETDGSAENAMHQTARYLALGLSNIRQALNPAHIVLAGRLTTAWDFIKPEISKFGFSGQVRIADLPAEQSLLRGAVCLALSETFASPNFG